MTIPVQLLVYRFGDGASFEGRLVGALERTEAGGALQVLDVLFVACDAATGEISAVERHGGGAGGIVSALVGFRLDSDDRRRSTRRAVATTGSLVEALGAALAPGEAVAAVLVGHEWIRTLADAVERTGGGEIANRFVGTTRLADIADDLIAGIRW